MVLASRDWEVKVFASHSSSFQPKWYSLFLDFPLLDQPVSAYTAQKQRHCSVVICGAALATGTDKGCEFWVESLEKIRSTADWYRRVFHARELSHFQLTFKAFHGKRDHHSFREWNREKVMSPKYYNLFKESTSPKHLLKSCGSMVFILLQYF